MLINMIFAGDQCPVATTGGGWQRLDDGRICATGLSLAEMKTLIGMTAGRPAFNQEPGPGRKANLNGRRSPAKTAERSGLSSTRSEHDDR